MSPIKKITVQDIEISVSLQNDNEDYICLTDMIKAKDGDFVISDWLRNRDTIEYLGAWESLTNPDFNYGEFTIIRNESGSRAYRISIKDWVERTKAIGIVAKTGRYGGTYAYLREIAQSQLPRLNAIDAEKGFRAIKNNKNKQLTKQIFF
ncbi:hypothetical protein FACS189413_08480 [Bacteroidia bacterium]|nr:hypothetical protein FACS189413_08480 [Bacteroidia bacterium]